jgi:GT2 family glycosyltransferase
VLTAKPTAEHTQRCLEHVERYTRVPYELILIRTEKKSFSFSRENNRGIRISDGRYIVLLNDDCFVSENWLAKMVKTAESDPKIGIVGARLYSIDGYPVNVQLTPSHPVAFALALIKREVIQKIGYLDENFKVGQDDNDYCVRARKAGFNITTSEATAVHLNNVSSKSLRGSLQKQRSVLMYHKKYGITSWKSFTFYLLWTPTAPFRYWLQENSPVVFRHLKFILARVKVVLNLP